jgi:hypothetical protein
MNTAINEQQLSKTAYVYVRQSTLAQVRHHQESTERQYALKEKALQLGWNDSTVQILDRDLGKSGAQITGREDFKTLVAEVSMGQVGAVFALEVSRLARSNLDWHRLRALQPAELKLALAALEELEARDHTVGRQWQMRLERAEYEAELAERRYQEVDPSQRLVAATLERRWNAALLQLEQLKQQAADFQRQHARVATPEQRRRSSPWPKIFRSCGMLPPRRPKTVNGCCDCSSRTLPSRSSHPSSSRSTFAGRGMRQPASLFRSRPT